MCDHTPPYNEGTWVWAKVMNNVWWPGKIVQKDKVPSNLVRYIKNNLKKNGEPFEIVFFDSDNT